MLRNLNCPDSDNHPHLPDNHPHLPPGPSLLTVLRRKQDVTAYRHRKYRVSTTDIIGAIFGKTEAPQKRKVTLWLGSVRTYKIWINAISVTNDKSMTFSSGCLEKKCFNKIFINVSLVMSSSTGCDSTTSTIQNFGTNSHVRASHICYCNVNQQTHIETIES
jgi:hypothetical protein